MAKTYAAANNTSAQFYPGVPLGDLSTDFFNSLPTWLQASIDASTIYADVAVEDS